MSKIETPEITTCPLAAPGVAGVIVDLLGGALVAAVGWTLIRFMWPGAVDLMSPLMIASYAVAGVVMTGTGRELLDSLRQRGELRRMSGSRPGEAPPQRAQSDRWELEKAGFAPIWTQVVDELRRHKNDYETMELPKLFVGLHGYWRDVLDRRFLIAIVLTACPLILGLFAGLNRLELSQPGSFLSGFGTVFQPLIVASIVSVVAVVSSLIVRFHWDATLLQWQKTACDLILRQLTAEDLARREDRRGTPVSPAEPSTAQPSRGHDVAPAEGRGKIHADARPGEGARPVEVAAATGARAEGSDGWGAFGAGAGGIRVKDRRDLNQPDHATGDAHG